MRRAALAREENLPGADGKGRQYGGEMHLDRQRRAGKRGEVHFAGLPSCLLKNATTAALNSWWKAARSKPAESRQTSGAASASALLHGARNAKCPASGTRCVSGGD